MQLDAELLDSLSQEVILHFYEWEKSSISYGYFIQPRELLHLKTIEEAEIDLAKRPTGGGIVFHLWDFAFSVLVPASSPHYSVNTLENYSFINRIVLQAVQEFLQEEALILIPQDAPARDAFCKNFCMAAPTKYDVVFNGLKVAGAAQRRCRQGFLHQGTISLVLPEEALLRRLLLPGSTVAEAILAHTYPLLGRSATPAKMQRAKGKLRELLQKSLEFSILAS